MLGGEFGVFDSKASPHQAGWLEALAADLRSHRRRSLILAGDAQPPEVHALAHALNDKLGNTGATVEYIPPVEGEWVNHRESLHQLAADLNGGRVELLVILGGNPVYTAPCDVEFAAALAKAGKAIHLSLDHNETSELCHWHIPQTHPFETWSDLRADDGTATIVQPLIAPLYDGKTEHELLSALTDKSIRPPYDCVRDTWKAESSGDDFEKFWEQSLQDGVIAETRFQPSSVMLNAAMGLDVAADDSSAEAQPGSYKLELLFAPDPSVWDGRYANNGWLQELPKPFTKLTWDNAALLSPATAKILNFRTRT